jgi:hypothetical protein
MKPAVSRPAGQQDRRTGCLSRQQGQMASRGPWRRRRDKAACSIEPGAWSLELGACFRARPGLGCSCYNRYRSHNSSVPSWQLVGCLRVVLPIASSYCPQTQAASQAVRQSGNQTVKQSSSQAARQLGSQAVRQAVRY